MNGMEMGKNSGEGGTYIVGGWIGVDRWRGVVEVAEWDVAKVRQYEGGRDNAIRMRAKRSEDDDGRVNGDSIG